MAAFASSYIKTEASQVTRSADSASMTGTNFSSWFNNSEGTFFVEASASSVAASSSGVIRALNTASGSERMRLTFTNTGINFAVFSGNTTQASFALATGLTNNTFYKIVASYATNNVIGSANGLSPLTDNDAVIPVGVDQMQIGQDGAAASTMLNGRIKKIAYLPKASTATQAQALATP